MTILNVLSTMYSPMYAALHMVVSVPQGPDPLQPPDPGCQVQYGWAVQGGPLVKRRIILAVEKSL